MQGSVIGTHIVPQKRIELFQGCDGIQIQGIKPGFFQRPELAFDFCFAGAIPDFRMQEHGPDRTADEGKLLTHVAAAVIDIKFCGDPMGSYCGFQDFLEVVSVIVIKKPAAHQEPRVVVNDHDAVDPPALPVFGDIGKVTGICLPHLPESIFLEGFPVLHGRVARRFQVMFFYETLDGADADRGRDKGLFHKMPVDLGGIEAWECLLQPVDLFDGGIRQHTCGALVGTFLRHERVNAAILVERDPFAERFGAIAEYRAVRQGQGIFSDPPVIGIPGRIRIKAMAGGRTWKSGGQRQRRNGNRRAG